MAEEAKKETKTKRAPRKAKDKNVVTYPYVICRMGNKQYRVSEGDQLLLDKVEVNPGETLECSDVLFVAKAAGDYKLGQPKVAKASVKFEVLQQTLGGKITIRHYKRRHKSKKTMGHRQPFTRVQVKSLSVG